MLVAMANMVGVKARVVNRKQVDVTSFWLSWNALIAHCTRRRGALETVAMISLSTVPRLFRQFCHLRVGRRMRGGRYCRLAVLARRVFTRYQMTLHLDDYRCSADLRSSFQETVPRKTAKNTVKQRDGGVGSVVANYRDGVESSVVVTTLVLYIFCS